MKVPQNLRRVMETIIVEDKFKISEGTLGYLLGSISGAENSQPKLSFTSLCECYQFDVTHVPNDFFKSV